MEVRGEYVTMAFDNTEFDNTAFDKRTRDVTAENPSVSGHRMNTWGTLFTNRLVFVKLFLTPARPLSILLSASARGEQAAFHYLLTHLD